MDEAEKIVRFENEVEAMIARVRQEWGMTYAGMIGVLQIQVARLCDEANEPE